MPFTVNFTRLGTPIGDHKALNEVRSVYKGYSINDVYNTSSCVFLRAVQLLIAKKEIPADSVRFQYEGEPIEHDKFGRFTKVPPYFSSAIVSMSAEFENAVKAQVNTSLTEEQTMGIRNAYKSWFDTYIGSVFVPGYKFYYEPSISKDVNWLKQLADRPLLCIVEVGSSSEGQPVFAIGRQPTEHTSTPAFNADSDDESSMPTVTAVATAEQLAIGAFDEEGGRIVTELFDVGRAYESVGIDPTLVKPVFDIVKS